MADVISVPEIPLVLTEIQAGGGQSPAAAARGIPGYRGNPTTKPSTVFRWITKGTRAADGRVIKLEAVRVGSRWLTSRGAVARFVEALTQAATPTATPPTPRSPAARRKASERAGEELDKMLGSKK
jgi:hypothetical protein